MGNIFVCCIMSTVLSCFLSKYPLIQTTWLFFTIHNSFNQGIYWAAFVAKVIENEIEIDYWIQLQLCYTWAAFVAKVIEIEIESWKWNWNWLLNPVPALLHLGSICCQINLRRRSLLIESKQGALIGEALKTIKQIVEIGFFPIYMGKVVLTDINI